MVLDAYIIEEIKRQEEERRRKEEAQRPRLRIDRQEEPENWPETPVSESDEEEEDSGMIRIGLRSPSAG